MIGELIKIFRQERCVGVLELAQRLAINRISLFRIEKGERQPSEKTAIDAWLSRVAGRYEPIIPVINSDKLK